MRIEFGRKDARQFRTARECGQAIGHRARRAHVANQPGGAEFSKLPLRQTLLPGGVFPKSVKSEQALPVIGSILREELRNLGFGNRLFRRHKNLAGRGEIFWKNPTPGVAHGETVAAKICRIERAGPTRRANRSKLEFGTAR